MYGRPTIDVWLTLSGWIWLLYSAALIAAVIALSR
jgi:hypothetical protein